jgi:hypothetical protein
MPANASAILRRSDVKLTAASANAARQCLEVYYTTSSEVEAALAVCAGIREAAGIEDLDFDRFDDDVLRLLGRSLGLAVMIRSLERLKVEKVIDELERRCLDPEGASAMWNTLAAAVGDAEPAEVDPRILAIFRALRGGRALLEIKTANVKRPSREECDRAVASERQMIAGRESRPLPTKMPAPEEDAASDEVVAASGVRKPRIPGKIACRAFQFMHQGYVLVEHYSLEGTSSVSRLVPAAPQYDRPENPRYFMSYEEDFRLRNYDGDYSWELENAGWIREEGGFRDRVFVLTEEGREAACRLFGGDGSDMPVLDIAGRAEVDSAVLRLVTDELDAAGAAAAAGMDEAVLDELLDYLAWHGSDELSDRVSEFRERSRKAGREG